MSARFDLSGRVALVTGGNGGIGLGIAKGLAEAGAAIAVVGRDEAKNAAAVRELEAMGATAAGIEADVADAASCAAMVERTVARLGGLHILVCNAGINIRKPPDRYSAEEWRRILTINLDGTWQSCLAAYPVLCEAGGGKIITNGSMLSLFGAPFAAPYAASKGAVVQLTKSLATAWAKDNIQVNCILPGWIDTDLTRQARRDLPELNRKVLERTPAGRWGLPEDLAGTAVFLASPASDFVTGTAIPVDGGYSAQL